MEELVGLLKTQEITRSSRARIKRLTTSDLVIIDDLMFMPSTARKPIFFPAN
nr:hypothetical protein [Desulforamulus profundi]